MVFVRDLPKYKEERPNQIFIIDEQMNQYHPDDARLNTVELEEKFSLIYDLRILDDVTLESP
jgi:hypothetical protein